MNNVFVYCEIEGTLVQEVSQELLTKGRKLANELKVELHAVVAGTGIKGKVEDQILPYGVDKLFVFDGKDLFPYTSAPHTDILVNLFKEEQPQICLMGATVIGRDLGPRVSSSLTSGLTADCTELEIGPYEGGQQVCKPRGLCREGTDPRGAGCQTQSEGCAHCGGRWLRYGLEGELRHAVPVS